MTASAPIHLKPELLETVGTAAKFRGMSVERYVDEVLSTAAKLDADMAADLREADEDFAAGRFHSQEEVEKMFGVQREHRDAA